MKKTALASTFIISSLLITGCTGTEAPQTPKTVIKEEIQNAPEKTEASTTYNLDTNQSSFKWIGRKVTGSHEGNVTITEGEMFMDEGQIAGGDFTLNMDSITVTDIKSPNSNKSLVDHLKNEDFFNTKNHPESTFEIVSTKEEKTDTSTHMITGNLMIKGITREITFPAMVAMKDNLVTAKAEFNIDRTEWDIKYGSGSFFDDLGDKAIDDEFTVELLLTFNAA